MVESEAIDLALPNLDGSTVTEVTRIDDFYIIHFVNDEYYKSKNISDMKVGAGPILVNENTKEVFLTGSGQVPIICIRAYKECGDINAVLTPTVEVFGWEEGANKVQATKYIKNITGIGLKESKNIIDIALNNKVARFRVSTVKEAEEAVSIITKYGFKCKQLWSNQC